jgi:UDP-N-acetylglucosamine diphosphorylase / glucose-1-phosphate thymidylyltransferase / UDP-N-acetylgalactosamine diphosphorylase / glucosamine-1-phosphate N-acetyltransferase / galactosamine-1-phosphate N-acetyltransferase
MKAVILAAGKGTRMGKLTQSTPKALLKKDGKPLIRYGLEVLPPGVTEILIIIEYLGDQIREHVGNSWAGIPVRYIQQGEKKGSAGALWAAREQLKAERFLVLPCDDLYVTQDILKLIEACPSMLASKVTDRVCPGGNIEVDQHGNLAAIHEGVHQPPCFMVTSVYFLDDKVFDLPIVKLEGKDEYGLPQTLASSATKYPVHISLATEWIQVVTDKDVDH